MSIASDAFESAIAAFHLLRDQAAAAALEAGTSDSLPLPRLHPANIELGRSLADFERSVWEVLPAWPADRVDDLGDILTFFQRAAIGRLTVRELIDAAHAENLLRN